MITSHISKVRYKIQVLQTFPSFKTYFLLSYVMCIIFVAVNVCHGVQMEVRGQLCGVLFFHGIQKSNSVCCSHDSSIFTYRSISQTLSFCDVGYWTQRLRHPKQVFYHWDTLSFHSLMIFQRENILKFVRIKLLELSLLHFLFVFTLAENICLPWSYKYFMLFFVSRCFVLSTDCSLWN